MCGCAGADACARAAAKWAAGCGSMIGGVKRWRHLDLGCDRCVIECRLRRLRCPDCGLHLEAVPWARPGSQHTRDLEDVVAWLAQQMAKTPICGLLRIGWDRRQDR